MSGVAGRSGRKAFVPNPAQRDMVSGNDIKTIGRWVGTKVDITNPRKAPNE